MKELSMFQNFLESRQTVSNLKQEIEINSKALKKALQDGQFKTIVDLKVQRDNLKNMLIEALEAELKKVA